MEPLGTIIADIKAVRAAEYPGLARLERPSPPSNLRPKKTITNVDRCGACHYWTKRLQQNFGWCHRYPKHEPKRPDQWCGEYKEKE